MYRRQIKQIGVNFAIQAAYRVIGRNSRSRSNKNNNDNRIKANEDLGGRKKKDSSERSGGRYYNRVCIQFCSCHCVLINLAIPFFPISRPFSNEVYIRFMEILVLRLSDLYFVLATRILHDNLIKRRYLCTYILYRCKIETLELFSRSLHPYTYTPVRWRRNVYKLFSKQTIPCYFTAP